MPGANFLSKFACFDITFAPTSADTCSNFALAFDTAPKNSLTLPSGTLEIIFQVCGAKALLSAALTAFMPLTAKFSAY